MQTLQSSLGVNFILRLPESPAAMSSALTFAPCKKLVGKRFGEKLSRSGARNYRQPSCGTRGHRTSTRPRVCCRRDSTCYIGSVVQQLLVMRRFPSNFHAHYKLEHEIGRGAWATVQLATELKSGEKYIPVMSPATMIFFLAGPHCLTLCGCMQTGCQGPGEMD